MPQLENALLELAKWLGLLDGSGSVQWDWFDHIGDKIVGAMAGDATRAHLELMLQALIDKAPIDFPGGDANQRWIDFEASANFAAGLTWNKNGDLRVGVAGDASFPVGKNVDLSLIVRLLHIDKAALQFKSDDLGSVKFMSHLPTPDFLQSISFDGEITHTPPPKLALAITESQQRSRTIAWDKNDSTRGWDAIRLVLFVLEAWFHNRNGKGEFFNRVNAHLFPMFGDPPTNLTPTFPLFQDIGQPVDFKAWADSIIKPGDPTDDASRILTYLWHLHALITGNNSPSFFKGSPVYFPLTAVANQVAGSGNPPTPQNALGSLPAGPGAYVGLDDYGGVRAVVLKLVDANKTVRIPLVGEGGTRPPVAQADVGALAALSMPAGSLPATMTATGNTVTFLTVDLNDPAALQKTYAVRLKVSNGNPVTYVIGFPVGDLLLPPPSPEAFTGLFLHWILNIAGTLAGPPVDGVLKALALVIDKAFTGNVDTKDLALAVVKAVAANLTLNLGPLAVAFKWPVISVGLTLSNLNLDSQNTNLRVGSMSLAAGVDCATGGIGSTSFALHDVRLTTPPGSGVSPFAGAKDATGLAAQLLPDLASVPGFTIAIAWDKQQNPALSISGSAKIPIEKNIGPLNIGALYVKIDNSALDVGIDLSFELGPVLIAVHDLGVNIKFSGAAIQPRLRGLGIRLDADVVKLSGMFGEVDRSPQPSDYVGGASLTVIDLFQLSAIGGYTQTDQGDTSIFVFAALNAPVGGMPSFFITGIACAFGHNRTLPPPGLLNDHPFMKVMRGDIGLDGDMGAQLAKLSGYFQAADGVNWVAAGIQFMSFGFIHGTIIVAVQFGQKFALDVLGSASFAIEPIVFFEIDIEAAYDGEKFILVAKVSPSSYLIHPDIFRLEGSFALGIWNDGDFVLAIGGFHPCFQIPDRYNQAFHTLARVGVKASLFGFIKVVVECFFACTNHALMAGASVSLSADLDLVSAGLDVYVDVLICWDPFFIMARLGVTVWFEFCGRHEIGVDLQIWTPDFGGTAHISIFIVSFDIDFGSPPHNNDPPWLHQFITSQLGVTASGGGTHHSSLPLFNTAGQAGLVRLNLIEGRSAKDQPQQSKSAEQEGLTQAIEVRPEFKFKVLSKLPLEAPSPVAGPGLVGFSGTLLIPLCSPPPHGLGTPLTSTFTVTASSQKGVVPITPDMLIPMSEQNYPASEFGGPLVAQQADDARSQVASIDNTPANTVVHLVPGFTINWTAKLVPANLPAMLAAEADFDESDLSESYPLPLGIAPGLKITGRQPIAKIKTGLLLPVKVQNPKRDLRQFQLTAGPPVITQTAGSFVRTPVLAGTRRLTLATVPMGVRPISPPASPTRTADLFGVSLRVTPPHAAAQIGRARIPIPVPAPRRRLPSPLPPVPKPTAATVTPGAAAHFHVAARSLGSIKLTATGNQMVRTVCLNEFESPIADIYLPPAQAATLPAVSRRIVCVGEGSAAPVSGGAASKAIESIGIERDTALLVIGGRTFAAHGCVLTSNARLAEKPDLLSTLPGEMVLQRTSVAGILFPAIPANWTLAIMVAARVVQPDSATDQVRWQSLDAALGSLRTVVTTGQTAFLMTIDALGPWTLQVELGPQWRLIGIAASDMAIADLAAQLITNHDWDLVDDRFEQPAAGLSAGLNLEVA